MDTEVTKLIETLRSISNILEENYGQRTRETVSRSSIGDQTRSEQSDHVPDPIPRATVERQEVQTTPVYQPVHQLPMASTDGQQLDVAHANDVSGSAEVVTGTFDNLPVLLPSTETTIQPEIISDKDRIRQLERELSAMQRQHNVNFNFAPVNIGGTNGQSSN